MPLIDLLKTEPRLVLSEIIDDLATVGLDVGQGLLRGGAGMAENSGHPAGHIVGGFLRALADAATKKR